VCAPQETRGGLSFWWLCHLVLLVNVPIHMTSFNKVFFKNFDSNIVTFSLSLQHWKFKMDRQELCSFQTSCFIWWWLFLPIVLKKLHVRINARERERERKSMLKPGRSNQFYLQNIQHKFYFMFWFRCLVVFPSPQCSFYNVFYLWHAKNRL